jgi:hypothetical protein
MDSNELKKKTPISRLGFIDEHENFMYHHRIASPEMQPFKLAVQHGNKEWEELAEKFDMGRSPVHLSRCLTNLSTRERGRRNLCNISRLRITMLHLRGPKSIPKVGGRNITSRLLKVTFNTIDANYNGENSGMGPIDAGYGNHRLGVQGVAEYG